MWSEYLKRENLSEDYLTEIKKYEKEVLSKSNIISLFMILVCVSGCKMFQSRDPWKKKQIDGEFYYYVKNESATILGLVSEGKEREELVIPETLGGYPVKKIGAFSASIGSSIKYYGIDATNIDRIVINHKCEIDMYQSIINLTGPSSNRRADSLCWLLIPINTII